MSHEQRAALDKMLRPGSSKPPPSIVEMRDGFVTMMSEIDVPDGIRTTPSSLGDRPALLVEPVERDRPGTILYFHGGGYVIGSPQTALALTAHLVTRTGARALSLDYRLAPEHPYPAALEDALSAYRALLDDGHAPSTIAFAGDSAGGGISVGTLLGARAAGLPMPAAIVAFSPALDATHTGESMHTKRDADPLFTPESLARTDDLYVDGYDPRSGRSRPGGRDRRDPLLCPATLADPTGFPPMLLQVGTNELLLSDSTRMAARASAAGVDVLLDITADVPHVFQLYAGTLDEADRALDRAALFLSQHLGS
jgi:epsilon-lactone hydrolase